jgi:hypothetical protein
VRENVYESPAPAPAAGEMPPLRELQNGGRYQGQVLKIFLRGDTVCRPLLVTLQSYKGGKQFRQPFPALPGISLALKLEEPVFAEEMSLMTGETHEQPAIHWDGEDKYAIIAFLLLSLDKKADENGMVRFDGLFGLNDATPENEEDRGDDADSRKKRETRDAIVRECEAFLDRLDADERYDAIVDEIDRFIQGEDATFSKCAIGGSYRTFGGGRNGKLDGNAHRLYELVKLVIADTGYSGSKRRLLKHLARKWDLDPSALPVLENAARLLPETARKRQELSDSDLPHREVAAKLAELDAEEQETGKQLKSLGIAETLAASAYIASQYGILNSLRALNGEEPVRPDINEIGVMADGGEEDAEPGFGEKVLEGIGDGICAGIETVTRMICAPFDFLAEKISRL